MKKLVYQIPMAPFFVLGFIAVFVIIPFKVGYRRGARAQLAMLDWAKA